MGMGQADLNAITSNAWEESSLYNMLRLVYTYNDRYIVTGTIRRDGFRDSVVVISLVISHQ